MRLLGERIHFLRKEKRLNSNDFGKLVGMSSGQVSLIERGKSKPNKSAILLIQELFSLAPGWLQTGEGEMFADSKAGENPPSAREIPANSEFVRVPRYNIKVSAGHGTEVHSEQIVDYFSFKKVWIKEKLKAAVKDLIVIEVSGDSMVPALFDGDLILINRTIQKFKGDAIYVLNYDGDLQVKRIQKMPNGDLVIKGDNPAYEPFTLTGDRVDQLKIIGRVSWFGREI